LSPVFIFCAPALFFCSSEGVLTRFHVFAHRTRFRRYRGRQILFSGFVLPDSCSAIPWASAPIFMFCAPGHVFCGAEGVGSSFHVLRSWTRFRRFRGRRVPFSSLALIGHDFDDTEGVGSSFMFCAPIHVFGGTDGVRSRFHFLRSWTRFRRCRGHRVPFTCFASPYSFSAVASASGPVFMFCATGHVSAGMEGGGSCFHVLHSRTRFRRYRGRRVTFSFFARPNPFLTVPTTSGAVFMFRALGLVFGGSESVGFRFHVLRPRTRCWR
jgi:hypothetical protein